MDENERASLQLQIDNLKNVNSELVSAVQNLKLSLKQKSTDYLELQRELNHLRLKLFRIQSSGTAQARDLGTAVQSNIKEAVSSLVHASNFITTILELTNNYIRGRQELETSSPRWSNLSSPKTNEKLNKVRPLSVGGHNIQPVVALSRMPLTANVSQVTMRSPTQNNPRERTALPMHLLQDLYIPLMRIDSSEFLQSNEEEDIIEDDSVDDLGLNESHNDLVENMDSILVDDDIDSGRTLNEIQEDIEPEEEADPPREQTENPMEGPSWLLDVSTPLPPKSSFRINEPDSTTDHDEPKSPEVIPETPQPAPQLSVTSRAFTPTVRRRKRLSSASCLSSPTPPPARRQSKRVLKVLVARIDVRDSAGEDNAPSEPFVIDDLENDVTDRSDNQCVPKRKVPTVRTEKSDAGGDRTSEPVVSDPHEDDVTHKDDVTHRYVSPTSPITHKDDASHSQRVLKKKVLKVSAEVSDAGGHRTSETVVIDTHEDDVTHSQRVLKRKVPKVRAEESDARGDRPSEPVVSDLHDDVTHSKRSVKPKVRESDAAERTSQPSTSQHQNGDAHSRKSRRTLNSSDDASDTSRRSHDDDKRGRRNRKAVVYKEKPLNRKLRR